MGTSAPAITFIPIAYRGRRDRGRHPEKSQKSAAAIGRRSKTRA